MTQPTTTASGTTATGKGHEGHDDHICHEVIRLLKETLNYQPGDHHTFFVFGATLDIALKKIYPTLWALYRDELMPKKTAIVGYARSTLSVAQFRLHISKYIKLKDANEDQLFDQFLQHNVYVQGKYNEPEDFKLLVQTVEMLEQTDYDDNSVANNRLFYLALPPSVFEPVTKLISEFVTSKSGWNRVIIEKPFGNDTDSSETLSRHLLSLYKEEELYRIDHYLDKEMIQNLMVLRFGNRIFGSVWNRENIQSVHISFEEPFGTMGNGGYFDQFGIIRDVMQNHLLQILCLVAMEKPVSTNPEDIRDEKVKLLRAMKTLTQDDVVLGQYIGNPKLEGDAQLSYLDDKTVPAGSLTPTFALAMCKINNERWDGAPFFMRCGKVMNERKTEIRIQFRDVPDDIFGGQCKRNELVIRVQPNEAIYVKFMSKSPGMTFRLQETELDLTCPSQTKDSHLPDAYERTIMDVFAGSQMNFVRSDELVETWRIFTPLLHDIEGKKIAPLPYLHSSRGPKQADDFCINNGFKLTQALDSNHSNALVDNNNPSDFVCGLQLQRSRNEIPQIELANKEKEQWQQLSERETQHDIVEQNKSPMDELTQKALKLRKKVNWLLFQLEQVQRPEHLNNLPYVPLRTIFSYLPLQDVLQMARVCQDWMSFQVEIASKTNSITILVGSPVPLSDRVCLYSYFPNPHMQMLINDDGTRMFPKCRSNDNCLQVHYRSFRSDTVQFLASTLPNIDTLQFIINWVSFEVLDQVMELIQLWSAKLTTLKLWCIFSEIEESHPMANKVIRLLQSINTLPLLEHLTFEVPYQMYIPIGGQMREVNANFAGVLPLFEMPILARLHQFYFFTSDWIEYTSLFFSLKKYVPSNSRLTHIGLGNRSKSHVFSWFADLCPTVSPRITSLMDVVSEAVQPIFSGFGSLTELRIDYDVSTRRFSQMINSISSLNQLRHLHLELDFALVKAIPFTVDDCTVCTPQSQISQLVSVKMMSIKVLANHHSVLHSVHWGWAFPSVQIIELLPQLFPFDIPNMLQTFLQCPKLKQIFTLIRDEEDEWTEYTVVETDGQKALLGV